MSGPPSPSIQGPGRIVHVTNHPAPAAPPSRHRCLRLLKTEGTIPVHYQGAKYNIPILVWILEHYPLQVEKGGGPLSSRDPTSVCIGPHAAPPLIGLFSPLSGPISLCCADSHHGGQVGPSVCRWERTGVGWVRWVWGGNGRVQRVRGIF